MKFPDILNSADLKLGGDGYVDAVTNIPNGEIHVDRYTNMYPPYAPGPNSYYAADMANYYQPGAMNMYVFAIFYLLYYSFSALFIVLNLFVHRAWYADRAKTTD